MNPFWLAVRSRARKEKTICLLLAILYAEINQKYGIFLLSQGFQDPHRGIIKPTIGFVRRSFEEPRLDHEFVMMS